MAVSDLEQTFPGLAGSSYRFTSSADPSYNCAAWAAGDNRRWWDPSAESGNYWPAGIQREHSLENLIRAFETMDYVTCASGALERGIEKLAIFADARRSPTHVARQLPSGAWTSKLGVTEDIEHSLVTALEGVLYGTVVAFLRRPARQGG